LILKLISKPVSFELLKLIGEVIFKLGYMVSIVKLIELKFSFPSESLAQTVTLCNPSLQTTEVIFAQFDNVLFTS